MVDTRPHSLFISTRQDVGESLFAVSVLGCMNCVSCVFSCATPVHDGDLMRNMRKGNIQSTMQDMDKQLFESAPVTAPSWWLAYCLQQRQAPCVVRGRRSSRRGVDVFCTEVGPNNAASASGRALFFPHATLSRFPRSLSRSLAVHSQYEKYFLLTLNLQQLKLYLCTGSGKKTTLRNIVNALTLAGTIISCGDHGRY